MEIEESIDKAKKALLKLEEFARKSVRTKLNIPESSEDYFEKNKLLQKNEFFEFL